MLPDTNTVRRNVEPYGRTEGDASGCARSSLPELFVVGAAKSGTTALYHYFKVHPQVFAPASIKEANYMAFCDGLPALNGPGDREALAGQSITRLEDYIELYGGRSDEQVAVDVSPAYLYYPQAAAKIANLCPEAKIVIVLRNPVECAFSMYSMMRRYGREPCLSFREAFHASPQRMAAGWEWAWDYQRCSLFSEQVARYLNLFPRRQLFIRRYEELKSNPLHFYRELTDFVGVESIDLALANLRVNTAPSRANMIARRKLGRLLLRACRIGGRCLPTALRTSIRQRVLDRPAFVLSAQDHQMLIDHFASDIRALSQLLSWDLSPWVQTSASAFNASSNGVRAPHALPDFLRQSSSVSVPSRRHIAPSLPNVFVVGAAKSGTTALYQYFKLHPQAFAPESVKEANYMAFYDVLPPLTGPGDQRVARYSVTNRADYQKLYSLRTSELIAADVSPSYLYFSQAPQKIAELCPDAKIVMVLRNPVEAAFSMYCMMRRDRREPCWTFRKAFYLSPKRLADGWQWFWDLQGGWMYAAQVRRYLSLFANSQLFIRRYDEMQNQPEEFYRDLTTFLGIDPVDIARANRRINLAPSRGEMLAKHRMGRNLLRTARVAGWCLPSSLRASIRRNFSDAPAFALSADDRRMLTDHYAADIRELAQMLSWDLSDWLKF